MCGLFCCCCTASVEKKSFISCDWSLLECIGLVCVAKAIKNLCCSKEEENHNPPPPVAQPNHNSDTVACGCYSSVFNPTSDIEVAGGHSMEHGGAQV